MAAGSTYEPIATTTLSSAQSSITFSSIPTTYTDLRLIIVANDGGNASSIIVQFNSDTGTNYSYTRIQGNGTAASTRLASGTNWIVSGTSPSSASYWSLSTLDIFSYAGNTYKTVLNNVIDDENGFGTVASYVQVWRSTSAINTIKMSTSPNTYNFAIGTTATLYGIKAA